MVLVPKTTLNKTCQKTCKFLAWTKNGDEFILENGEIIETCKFNGSHIKCLPLFNDAFGKLDDMQSSFVSDDRLYLATEKAIYSKPFNTKATLEAIVEVDNIDKLVGINGKRLFFTRYDEKSSRIKVSFIENGVMGDIIEPVCELNIGTREMKLKQIPHWNVDMIECENREQSKSSELLCSVLVSQPFIPPQRYIYSFENDKQNFIPVEFTNVNVFNLSTEMKNPDYFLISNFTMFTEYVQNEPIQFLLPPFREDLTDQDQWRAGQYRVILKISENLPKIQAKFGNWYDKFIVSYSGAAIVYINSDLLKNPEKFSKIFREITSLGEFRQSIYNDKNTRFYNRQLSFAEQIESVGYHVQNKGYPISFWGPDVLFWVQGSDAASKLGDCIDQFVKYSVVKGVVFEDDYVMETERGNYVGSDKNDSKKRWKSNQVKRLEESLKSKISSDAEIMVLVRDGKEASNEQLIFRDIRDDFIKAGDLPLYLTYKSF